MSNSTRPLRLDTLYDVKVYDLKQVIFHVTNTLSTHTPAQIVAGVGALFLLLCKRYGVEPRRVLEANERMMRDAQDNHPVEMRAIKTYLREDLADV